MRSNVPLRVLRATALVPLALLTIPPDTAFGQSESIVLGGELAPDTGGGTFGLLGQPDLNDDGEVVFHATIAGGTTSQGIFVGDGTTIRSVALEGELAPGGAGTFGSFFAFGGKIDDQGDVAFLSILTGGTWGIFLEGPSGLEPLVLSGGIAPGTAGIYAPGFGMPDLNDDGEVAFTAAVIALPPTTGVFVESDLGGRLVVESGDTVPGVAGASFVAFGNPVLNDNGQVAFTADVAGPGGATTGLWVYSSAGVGTLVALEGQVAPGTGGATFEAFGTLPPSIDAVGNVYFEANLSAVAGTVGHFVGDGTTLAAIALAGDPVPGPPGSLSIESLRSEPEASRTGGVAFIANLDVIPSVEAVYFDPATGGARVEIAREDGPAPDTGGGTYQGFSARAVPNVGGEVAFLCGVAGSPTTTVGIFVPEPAMPATLAAGAIALWGLAHRWSAGRGGVRRRSSRQRSR